MPQYFKNNGYQVYGTGKLYHPNRPLNNDLPRSWTDYSSATQYNASCNGGRVRYSSANNVSTGEGKEWRRIVDCEENDSESQLTYAAIQYLHQAVGGSSSGNSSSYRPFFIGMGHHRPHLPWNSPARFIEQYGDPEQYPLAKQQTYPATASTMQWHPWFDQVLPIDVEPSLKQHYLRVGYYGAVSYYDYHFGLMLDALEDVGVAQDTVVLVSGDHGWHLGERNMLEKKGLDELDCHIPLLIRVPWIPAASSGVRTSAFAEAVE
jgi:iduronate 2-sulfatase